MPILNYTTEVDVHRTVGEIQACLAKAGAMAVSVDYGDQGQPVALMFLVKIQDTPVSFRLPSRHQGVYRRLNDDPNIARKFKTEIQAQRVAWRIVKDWIEAQMAIIDAGQAELAEVFLPYAVTGSGATVYQAFKSDQKLLQGG